MTTKIDDLTNSHLVTLAVMLLGGDTDYCDREDIAIKVNEIAPERFTWRKYPERIDLSAVGTALRDAKKPKNGSLVTGNNVRGWMLTSNGINLVNNLDIDFLDKRIGLKHRRNSISENIEIERARLKGTLAYHLYISGEPEQITIEDFYQFARVNEYFKSRSKDRRFAIIDNAVDGDDELSRLWAFLKDKFLKEIERNG